MWGREHASKNGREDGKGAQGRRAAVCGGQAGEVGGLTGRLEDSARRRLLDHSSLTATAQGGVPQGSTRRVGSLWEEALQAQKRGEAAFLSKQAQPEQAVSSSVYPCIGSVGDP